MVFERKLSSYEMLDLVESVKRDSGNIEKSARNLKDEEVKTLKQNGNFSSEWDRVKILNNVKLENIRNNIFIRDVIISSNIGKPLFKEIALPCGIFNSTIQDCIIDEDVLIKDVKLLNNYYIGKNVLLLNDGIITTEDFPLYGNGIEIPVGMETGGREIKTYAELTIEEAAAVVTNRDKKDLLKEYEKIVDNYIEKIKFRKGIILDNAKIINNKEIKNTFIGSYSNISGTIIVKDSTILSNKNEITEVKDGAYVINSIIQWGCKITSMGIVEDSVLTEHSHVERQGKVTNSIIGPNTDIGEGEVTSSLVGPFVGFHHQSLLIGAIWADGRGNIGYGANVGSNHTSKAPDQEIFPGEGMFFGLGVNIKFPANFKKAPYSVIATGVTTLPQRIEFPFSLINTPAERVEGISPAYNEILPGWVLSDNIFTIKRSEVKYRERNRARRTEFIFEIFRPEIVDLMIQARQKLSEIKEKKEVYLDKEIKSIGKNYLYERNRLKAIKSYSFYIRYYGLKGLKNRILYLLKNGIKKVSWDFLEQLSDDARWEHEKKVLKAEFPEERDSGKLLELLLEMEEKIADDVKISKEKDDIRGRKIIDDYDFTHTIAADDSFVKQTYRELEIIKKEIMGLKEKVE